MIELQITVQGHRRSFKSKVTYLLKEFLKEKGFQVNLLDQVNGLDEGTFDKECLEYMDLLLSLKKEIQIKIKIGEF